MLVSATDKRRLPNQNTKRPHKSPQPVMPCPGCRLNIAKPKILWKGESTPIIIWLILKYMHVI